MKEYVLRIVGGLLLILVVMAPAQAQPGGGGGDEQVLRKMWDELRQQDTPLEKANPQQAIDHYTKFLNGNAHNNPALAIDVVQTIAHLYAYDLKDTDKAVALLEAGLKQFPDDPQLVLLREEGNALLNAQRNESSIQLFKGSRSADFSGSCDSGAESVTSLCGCLAQG